LTDEEILKGLDNKINENFPIIYFEDFNKEAQLACKPIEDE
jgi:hypothetical protein